MMYRVKWKRLRQLIDELGDTGLAQTSIGTKVSVSTLTKMYAGTYNNSPRETVRERLAAFFEVDESDLFTRVDRSSKSVRHSATAS